MLLDAGGKAVRQDAFIVRATELSQFRNCPRNWFFTSHNGLNLERRVTNRKLRFGIVMHKALEVMYGGAPADAVISALNAALEEEREALDAYWSVELNQEFEEDRLLANSLMHEYMGWVHSENCSYPDSEFNFKHTERRVITQLPGTYAYLAVKMDAEAEGRIVGGYWVLEHKTRGKSTNVSNPQEIFMDLQLGAQLWTLSKEGKRPSGVLFNLIRKQMPGPRVKAPLFARHRATRTAQELRIFEETLFRVYHDMRDTARRILVDKEPFYTLPYNPQTMGVCSWGCPVKDLCGAICRGDDTTLVIESQLKPRDKDIWQVLEEDQSE